MRSSCDAVLPAAGGCGRRLAGMPALFAMLSQADASGKPPAGWNGRCVTRGTAYLGAGRQRPSAPELERQLGGGDDPSWRSGRPRPQSGHVQARSPQIHGATPGGRLALLSESGFRLQE